MDKRFAILIDGGFFTRKLQKIISRRPDVDDVLRKIESIRDNHIFQDFDLLRVYYYDARPATGKIKNPISGAEINLAETNVYRRNQSFLDALELKESIALRLGEVNYNGWRIKPHLLRDNALGNINLNHDDLSPDLEQKGVDLRIGLDIARLSLRGMVHSIVVVTGDSDLVPAFKFARREGIRVILSHMGHGVKRDLRAHTDLVLEEAQGRSNFDNTNNALESKPS